GSADRSGSQIRLLHSTPFHGRWNAHGFTIFGDSAPGDIDAIGSQQRDNAVIGENFARTFSLDHFADAVAHGLGGVRLLTVYRRNRGCKEILEFKNSPRCSSVFVRGDAAYSRLVHTNRLGYGPQIERSQVAHAVGQ